jgi:hypothetical protein
MGSRTCVDSHSRPSDPSDSLRETSLTAANRERPPIHASDGTRREPVDTQSARDTDLLAMLLSCSMANHKASEGIWCRPNAVTLGGGRQSGEGSQSTIVTVSFDPRVAWRG